MKKFLYIYLLLISTSVCAMQPANNKQIPMNKKPFLTRQEIVGGALVLAPIIHSALIPVCFIPSPLTLGVALIGAAKLGSGALGSAMIIDANQQRQNNNK